MYLITNLIPCVLNSLAYGVLIPFCTNVLEEYFLSILFIMCTSMVIACWKYIISCTMKFEFNPLTFPFLVPFIYAVGVMVFE